MTHHVPPPVVYTADIGAMMAILGTFFGFLPGIAALLGAIWYGILICDRLFGKKPNGDD